MFLKRRFCSTALIALTAIACISYITLGNEVEVKDRSVFQRQIFTDIPSIISFSVGDTVWKTGSPWDYFWLEGLAGTLGAAGGGIVGGLLGSAFCLAKDPVLCVAGVVGGFVIGTLAVPIIAVDAVGKAHGVRGNIVLAFLMEVGGLVCGFVLDMRLPIPLLTFVGAGFGAAFGYNIGATMVVPQPTVGKKEEVMLVSVILRW